MVSSELPVVLPGGEVRAHGVLALLPQHLLNERWIGHMNCQDGAEARLPHGPVPLHAFQLEEREGGGGTCENPAGYEVISIFRCSLHAGFL